MTTPQPPGPANEPVPASGLDPTVPVQRVLTGAGLRAIHAAAQAATSPAQLLHDCLTALDAALRTPASRAGGGAARDAGQPDAPQRLGGYAIPNGQWNAVFDAITGRAHAWGLAAELGLDLALNLMPATYDDPDPEAEAAEVPLLADLRPDEHHLTLTRDAVATIAACQAHLRRLASRYHPASPAYRLAADSWNDLLAVLLTAHPHARVTGHGDLGLLIAATGGTAWALTYRPDTRRCTTAGCQAVIDNDATARAPSPDATVLDHQHTPSYPLDGPAPGRWTATY
jgi:hypothetical protein